MTAFFHLEAQYDAFLFASLCEDDEVNPQSFVCTCAAGSRSVARGRAPSSAVKGGSDQ